MSKNIKLIFAIIFLLIFARFFWQKAEPIHESCRPALGTVVWIKISGPGGAAAASAAFQEIDRLSLIFDRFLPTSEVSRLNRAAGRGPRSVSPELFEVLRLAEEVRILSGGAFDVLLGKGKMKLEADGKVSLSAGAALDLGGIAKGYAIEKARELLLKRGVKNAIIDSRSSIAVIGGPWSVGVADPLNGEIIGTISLTEGETLGTSSQSEQPGHIVDPRRRRSAAELQSVTVINRDAARADAWSTALFVLGEEAGRRLAEKEGFKFLIIRKDREIYDNFGFELW